MAAKGKWPQQVKAAKSQWGKLSEAEILKSDGDPQQLLPHAPVERSKRFIEAMGGKERVRGIAGAALADDLRWALELSGILVAAADSDEADRLLLSAALRLVGQRTTSANIRNWCITRALDLEGALDMSPYKVHRVFPIQIMQWPIETAIGVLKVFVDPETISRHVGEYGQNKKIALESGITACQLGCICSKNI